MKLFFLSIFSLLFALNSYSQTSATWRIEYDSAKVNFINGKTELTSRWLENFLPSYRQNLLDTIQYYEMVHLLARCYMRSSKPGDAEKLFKEDINYFNEHPEDINKSTYTASTIYLGYLYYQRRQLDISEKYFEEGLKLKKEQEGEKSKTCCILLGNLATINNLQKDYTRADSLYQRLLEIKKDLYGKNSTEVAASINAFANMYKKMNRYSEAEPLYNQVISIQKQASGEKSPSYLAALNNLASLYAAQGRYNLAEPVYQQVLQTSKEIYNSQDLEYSKALTNLGLLYEQMGRFTEADTIFYKVLSLREESLGIHNLEYTEALINLANLYKTTSDYRQSEIFYKSALSIYEVIIGEKHETYIAALVNLAGLYRSMGVLTEAEPLYTKALKIYKETIGENTISYANILNNIALFYDETGNYEQSEIYYKRALEITKNLLGDFNPQYAITLNNMANLYKNTGHFEQAEPLYLQSAKIRKETLGEKHAEYASSINNLATLYEQMGRLEDAEPLYKQTLSIIKDLYGNKNPYYANALNNLAGLYQSQEKLDEAKKLYEESLEITRQILGEKHYTYGLILNNLALLQQQRGDFKQSEKLYLENIQKTKDALGAAHPNYAVSLNNLAGLYEHVGRYDDALKLYNEALGILKNAVGERHQYTTYTFSSLARVYTVKKAYNSADSMWIKTINNYLFEIQTFFPTMSEKEKSQFYQTLSNDFETFNSYALLRAPSNPGILTTMYNNQLATKALLLNSSNKLRQRILSSKDSSLVRSFKQWLSEKELLSKAYALSQQEIQKQHINIDSLEQHANELEKSLSARSEIFKSNEVAFYSWKEIQKSLASDEAAVEMIRFHKYKFDSSGVYSDSIYYAGLIIKHSTKEKPELVLMQDGNNMEGRYMKLYKNSVKYKIEDNTSYTNFWQPLQPYLSGIKRLYFSPDGVYNQINVNTLKNSTTGTYVLDELEIRLVTNTKDLLIRKNTSNAKKYITLFGNPDYTFEPDFTADSSMQGIIASYLEPLPGTAVEIEKINQEMTKHRWQSKEYLGQNASEKNLKSLVSPKVIHIATHGFFEKDSKGNRDKKSSENPLLSSGLMLSGASVTLYNREYNVFNSEKLESQREDGILTAYEAMNLNLDHTDLVVLSACETGLGQVKNGEGVYGLQRAFIIAGAKSIIISLWKVNDATTQKLMSYFYEEWYKNDNKNIAFKKAQDRLKAEFPDPYYWGAFIMVQ